MASSNKAGQVETTTRAAAAVGGRIQSAPAVLLQRRRDRLEGHAVAQLGFEGARHMLSNRLPSARRERVVGLRMQELNSELAESVLPLSETIRRLDLSAIRLSSLPTELLVEMANLERLDISRNQIQDLSPLCDVMHFAGLENLVEILAYCNSIKRLPTNFRQFSNLRRINLSSNLLTRCDGIDELKSLQVLILDNNRLESFSANFFENLRRLEVLHCAQNRITKLPPTLCNMRHLRNVDFSGNRLASIPPDLLQLHRMEVLNLSRNNISRVPTIQAKGIKRRPMNVDLSDNQLVRFPEQLLSMSRKIDLCRNQIQKIPVTVTKLCSEDDDKVIEIDDNPLISPPADICQCGTRAILRYFYESKVLMQNYEGLKVFVVGSSGQGKTSLVQTMIDDEPRLTGGQDRTVVLDIFNHYIEVEDEEEDEEEENEKEEVDRDEEEAEEKDEGEERVGKRQQRLHLSIWDFSGNDRYLVPLYHFLHLPSLCLIVFNIADYDDSNFDSLIGNWLKWIISKTNKLVLLPVATHSDMVSPSRKEEICRNVSLKIKQFLEDHAKFIDREIRRIESKPHIVPALSEHLKHCLSLKRLETVVHSAVIGISSKENDGFAELLAAVKSMATNKSVYEHVLRRIPSLWDQVESYVEERGKSASFPFLSWKDYEKEVVERFGMKRILTEITQHLHNTGKLLWFSESRCLKDFVFLKPEWLLEVFKAIYRHDLLEAHFSPDEYGFKSVGLGANKFDRLKRDFLSRGVLDKDYLRCILWPLFPTVDLNKQFLHLTTLLMNHFELGYIQARTFAEEGPTLSLTELLRRPIASSLKTSTAISETIQQSSKPTGTQVVSGSLVVCCLVNVPRPAFLNEQIAALHSMPCIVAYFRFALYLPPGILDRLICQFQASSHHNLVVVWHWETGLFAMHREKPICLLMEFKKLRSKHTTSQVIRLETRNDSNRLQIKSSLEELWTVMLPLLNSVDSFLSQFSGNNFTFLIKPDNRNFFTMALRSF